MTRGKIVPARRPLGGTSNVETSSNEFGVADSKLVGWYAARHTNGVEGQTVTTIPELSGSGAAGLFQNNSGKRVRWYGNVVNGLPTFRCTGVQNHKALWNQTVAQPYQTFIVLNTRTPFGLDDDEVYFSGYTANGSDKHLFAIINHDLPTVNQPVTIPDWMIEQAGNNQHVVGGLPVNDTWYVARIDWETTDTITVNGTVVASGDAGSLASTGITFAAREDGNRGTTGDIAELVFCKGLTSTEKAAIQTRLTELYL
jgi:hypothetical protein